MRDGVKEQGHGWPDYITCIARPAADGRVTWCGRHIAHLAFVFESIDHAAENGAQQGLLVACPECSEAAASALAHGVPGREPAGWLHKQGNHTEVSEHQLDADETARGWTQEPLYTAGVQGCRFEGCFVAAAPPDDSVDKLSPSPDVPAKARPAWKQHLDAEVQREVQPIKDALGVPESPQQWFTAPGGSCFNINKIILPPGYMVDGNALTHDRTLRFIRAPGVSAAHNDQRQVREADNQGLGEPGRLSPSDGVKANRKVCASPCMEGKRTPEGRWTGPCSCYPNAGVRAVDPERVIALLENHLAGSNRWGARHEIFAAIRALSSGVQEVPRG